MSNFVNLLDIIYPIGSIYVSAANVSPSDTIGGTWKKIEGKFLRGITSSDVVETIGGKEKHHHVVAMLWPEYSGWSNICGTKEGGYYPASGIVCMADGDGAFKTTFSSGTNYSLNPLTPVHRAGSGASNYANDIMLNNACHVVNTYVNVQYGSTADTNTLPPYYNVVIYQRVS